MRVLVALAGEPGRVFSRYDLTTLCWDGQIVGDNAISRVISRLRQTLAELAGDAVKLETINKVGFRLVNHSDSPNRPAPEPLTDGIVLRSSSRASSVDRRWLIGGGVAAILAVPSAVAWRFTSAHRPNPEAVRLLERGNAIMRSARMGSVAEAIRLFGQAVKVDPAYADGWGALSGAHRHALLGFGAGSPQVVTSAADRALALDPDQPDALVAKASIYPEYRNWLEQEKVLRRLVSRFPDHWFANARMGIILQEVGRFDDALVFTAKVPQIDAQLAPAWAGLIRTLTMAGRFQEADAAFDEAMAKIAPHPAVWFTRFSSLLESRRYGEAAAFARDTRTLPEELPATLGQAQYKLATALANDDQAGVSEALDRVKSGLGDPGNVPRAGAELAILGDPTTALTAYYAYLLGGSVAGHTYAVPGPLDLRSTQHLFAPSFVSSRSNPLFEKLLQLSGLEDYWKRSGSQPDFRRN